ncbi:MAG: MBL fold metallo-hydrolase [Verrucomicrobia bacterium]|nr:MBL fold metallo-hydrolase [Verrucomicrobiota bacterium]
MADAILTVLGSGSRGNSFHLEHRGTALLIDAGLSAKQLEARMEEAGAAAAELLGVVLTHEHGDHTAGLKTFLKKRKVPVYASHGTKDALEPHLATADWRSFEAGAQLELGAFRIETFPVPHDAAEPTDLGFVTRLVVERLRGCAALVLESNYDEAMLREEEKRPWAVKQRISARHGHLSNGAAAKLVEEVAGPELRELFLGHISEDCNRPELARKAMEEALRVAGRTGVRIHETSATRVGERVGIQAGK